MHVSQGHPATCPATQGEPGTQAGEARGMLVMTVPRSFPPFLLVIAPCLQPGSSKAEPDRGLGLLRKLAGQPSKEVGSGLGQEEVPGKDAVGVQSQS